MQEIRACLMLLISGSELMWRRVPYAALAKVFALIEATTKRLEKTSLLTSFLLLVIRRSAPGDSKSLLQTIYLCINKVRSKYCSTVRLAHQIRNSYALITLVSN